MNEEYPYEFGILAFDTGSKSHKLRNYADDPIMGSASYAYVQRGVGSAHWSDDKWEAFKARLVEGFNE